MGQVFRILYKILVKRTNYMNYFQNKSAKVSLNQLRNEGTIGEGSFGVVKVARHKMTRRRYAVKVLRHDCINSREEEEALETEKEILEMLDHRFVVKTWGVVKLQKATYVIMDYYGNATLLDYINNNKNFTSHLFKKFVGQMVSGLLYINDRDICHRDIKLENYVLDSRRELKLIDFGLSKKTKLRQRDRVGTPAYASPQLCDHNYDPYKSDIWALGVVMYCCVHGERPYDSDDFDEIRKLYRDQYKVPLRATGHLEVDKIIFNTLMDCEDKRWGANQLSECEWLNPIPNISSFHKTRIELSIMTAKKKKVLEQRSLMREDSRQSKYKACGGRNKTSEIPYMEISKQKERTKQGICERLKKLKVKEEPCSSKYLENKNKKAKKKEKSYKKFDKEFSRESTNSKHKLKRRDNVQSAYGLDRSLLRSKLRKNEFRTRKQLEKFFDTSENVGEFFIVVRASKEDVMEKCAQALQSNRVDVERVRDSFRCRKNFSASYVTWLMNVRVDFATPSRVTVKFVKKAGSDDNFKIISKLICSEFFGAVRRPQSCIL